MNQKALPDVSQWQPIVPGNSLSTALMTTCQLAQRRIVSRARAEERFNIQNFDSGAGVEDAVREELANLLPARYSVDVGVVDDRKGQTAGDCDLLVRDPLWSPAVKLGATAVSRRRHYPIEGLYAAAEIKQSLGLDELDAAMKKMVTVSRLLRPDNPYGHITENQHLPYHDQDGMILNPLHTSVFATRLKDGVSLDEVVERFGAINALLDRSHMVTALCVLDAGAAWYSAEGSGCYDADFMRDRQKSLVLQILTQAPDRVFYHWYVLLASHLTRSILNILNVSEAYGNPPPSRDVRGYEDAAFNSQVEKEDDKEA